MNPAAILQTQFAQVALPILIGMFIAGWWQNKRLDDIIGRLDRIEKKLETHGERLATLEGAKWR